MLYDNEEVFHFGGDDGGVSIFRTTLGGEVRFIYSHSECYLDDNEELKFSSKKEEFASFEEAFKQINDNYPWYSMIIDVNKDYKTYVLDQIEYSPNMVGKPKQEIEAAKVRANDKFEEGENLWELLNEE